MTQPKQAQGGMTMDSLTADQVARLEYWLDYAVNRVASWSRNAPDRRPKEIRALDCLAEAVATLSARVEALTQALEPFAGVADRGKRDGEFVIAKAIYSDMGGTTGVSAPRQSHWHWTDFERARAALTRIQQGTTP